jgi:nucleoside-diphosphate-sugar epimerase
MNPYAHSKILAEDLVRFYQNQFGIAATIIRPFNVYGSGQDRRFIVPSIVRQAVDPAVEEIAVRDLRPRRDYLHVADLAALIVAALRATPGGTYNAGSGQSISVGDLVNLVREVAQTAKPIRVTGEARTNEIPDVVADITRAAIDLDWRPQVTLRDGLRDTMTRIAREAASE